MLLVKSDRLLEKATRRLLGVPEAQSYASISEVLTFLDGDAAVETLETVAQTALQANDNRYLERMLLGQAQTLQAIFTQYTVRMSRADYLPNLQTFAQIALKAQNQCRQTLATLGELRHPRRATFIKQQNNAVNQQVNNGPVETEKNPATVTNKLLEAIPGERLELGTAAATGGGDPTLETVGAVHWPED